VVVNGIPQRRRASYGGGYGYGYGYGYGDYGYMDYGYGEEDVEERRLAKKQKALVTKPPAEPVATVIDSA
jgi:hypothetical protein